MHKTRGRGVLAMIGVIMVGCTTINTVSSPKLSNRDYITYQLINTSQYIPPSDGSMAFADAGTVVQKYHIKDTVLGLQFDYLFYQREKNHTIYDDVKRVYEKPLMYTGIRMRERGGWEFSLVDANKLNISRSSGCLLIDLLKNDQLHRVFPNREYSLYIYDTSSYDLDMLSKCLGVKQDQVGLPVFVSKKQTQASQVLMIYRPDGLGGAYDQSTISTLQWNQ